MDIRKNDKSAGHDDILEMLRPHDGTLWMYFISKPRCEKRLYEALKAQNIACYLPMITKTTHYSQRIYTREVAMFPNYVFASTCSMGFDIAKLNSSLLKVCFLPESLAAELLADLQIVRKYELLAKTHKVDISPEIVEGSSVMIKKGNFKGDYAIVEKRKNSKLIIVNLHSVEMSLHVEVPIDWVESF